VTPSRSGTIASNFQNILNIAHVINGHGQLLAAIQPSEHSLP